MRRLLRSLLLLFLSLLLIVGLAVGTFPWWGPGVLERGAAKVLRHNGFSEADVLLDAIGLSQSSLTLERLRYKGAGISNAGLLLGYDFSGLRKSELEAVTVTSPEIEIDLSDDWSTANDESMQEEPSVPRQLPERFPINKVNLEDAALTLRGADWSRTVALGAGLSGRKHLTGEATLQGEGIRLDARADMEWPEMSGRTNVSAKVDDPAEWVEFGQDRGWFSLPEGLGLRTGPFEIDAGAGFADQMLRDWNVELIGQAVAAAMGPSQISVGQVALTGEGDGVEVEHFDLEVDAGTAAYHELSFAFEKLLASANIPEQFDLRLSGWELSGETDLGGFGAVVGSAGEVALSVEGAWQAWRPNFELKNLALRMRVAEAPLSVFTGLGSVSGNWRLDAELSAGEVRTISLSTGLLDASLTAAAVSLESERLSVSVHGTLPGSLGAEVGVKNGRVTWSDGGGLLTGLEGNFELASLQPIASKGQQTFQFASIEQGEFVSGSGDLLVSYTGDRDEGPPLKLEITTTALGGAVRILVDGQVRGSPSLSIRVFLESVKLEEIAPLFPQFEGRIEGEASGELALRLEGTQIILLPGGIELVADTSGRFEYLQQGWLTQDPKLDPEAFVSERDVLEIMKDSRGAQVLTEVALRDLNMLEFNLKIEESATGDQSVIAKIRGNRILKGVTVPVVLDVPIRGDVKETINAIFEFNARM